MTWTRVVDLFIGGLFYWTGHLLYKELLHCLVWQKIKQAANTLERWENWGLVRSISRFSLGTSLFSLLHIPDYPQIQMFSNSTLLGYELFVFCIGPVEKKDIWSSLSVYLQLIHLFSTLSHIFTFKDTWHIQFLSTSSTWQRKKLCTLLIPPLPT